MKVTFTVDTEKKADLEELEEYLALLKKRHSGVVQTAAAEPERVQEAEPVYYDIPDNIDDYFEAQVQEYTPQQERPAQQAIRRAQPAQPARRTPPAQKARNVPTTGHQNKDVPFGVYNAILSDIRPDTTKSGKKMIFFDFTITYGEYENRHIFMRQVYSGTSNDTRCIRGIEKTINDICQATDVATFVFSQHNAQELEKAVETVIDEIQKFDAVDMKVNYSSDYTQIKVIQ